MTIWAWAAKQPIIKGKNEYGDILDFRVVPLPGEDGPPTDRYAYRRLEFLTAGNIAKVVAMVEALIGYKPDVYDNPTFNGVLDPTEARRDKALDLPVPENLQEKVKTNFQSLSVGRLFGLIYNNDVNATGKLVYLTPDEVTDTEAPVVKFVPEVVASKPEVFRRIPPPPGFHYELSNGMMSDMVLVKDKE